MQLSISPHFLTLLAVQFVEKLKGVFDHPHYADTMWVLLPASQTSTKGTLV